MDTALKPNLDTLYAAQKAAGGVNYPNILPCYSKEHLKEAEGFSGACKNVYAVIYTGVSYLAPLADAVSYVTSAIFSCLEMISSPIVNALAPINPVNGKRHVVLIPKTWEIALGKVFYSSLTSARVDVPTRVEIEGQPMKKLVSDVFHKLADSNPDVLNPNKKTPFEYNVRTVQSEQLNAFAVMGGGMVVFSQIVDTIADAIAEKKYQNTKITFADGSVATINMEGVTVKDVMAGLMGHEMTHVASRHSIVGIVGNIVRFVSVFFAKIFMVAKIKNEDKEYQELRRIPFNKMSAVQLKRLQDIEKGHARIGDVIGWLGSKLGGLLGLHYSRKAEYEADITGIHLSKNAGYDARGAILLQEILLNAGSKSFMDTFRKNNEWLFPSSHPHGENRKRGALAALSVVDPELVKKHITWDTTKKCKFHTELSDASVTFAGNLRQKLAASPAA